jgi:hypothetical protein
LSTCGQIYGNPDKWEEQTQGLVHKAGFKDFYWDPGNGKILLEVQVPGEEFLYVDFLASGVGSNDIGLDRGQLGHSRVVRFHRFGNKILLIQGNLRYRAESSNLQEVKAVEEAFAQSVLHAFEIVAEKDGRVLIDMTGLVISDAHGVAERLGDSKQGDYALDANRSVIFDENLRNFPQNTEFEALLTFTGTPLGSEIRSVVPSAKSVSVRQRHSFIQLPDEEYKRRVFDPRSGYFYIQYDDYAAPIGEHMRRQYIARHRLIKKDLGSAMGPPLEPIVYYVDPGTPEPILSALIEGASWWDEAFEAAGFTDAFRVEVLPDSADPLDIRYNVIQWVHRSTRGWSYGASVVDPRTGEIIKGHVSLGSLRVRQDYLIAEGLLAPYEAGKPIPGAMKEMALARLRQLSAHEVGHTLGLAHNYAASSYAWGSVMDYPHPFIMLDDDGRIDLSDAYREGIGSWDKVAIQYGYGDYGDGEKEMKALNEVMVKAIRKNQRYITDQDARPKGGAHPVAHLWDNGSSAVEELERIMHIRKIALEGFSAKAIPEGSPLASLERTLVPVYFLHRYQAEAAVKLIGGVDYNYVLRGDDQFIQKPVEPEVQWTAVRALLQTIRPSTLILTDDLLKKIPPPPPGYGRGREHIDTRTGPTFDPLAAAETAIEMVMSLLLHPQRCERLYQQKQVDDQMPGLAEYLDAIREQIFDENSGSGFASTLRYISGGILIDQLAALVADDQLSSAVRACSYDQILKIKTRLSAKIDTENDAEQERFGRYYTLIIDRLLETLPVKTQGIKLRPPDGSPIGQHPSGIGCGMLQCGQAW